MTSVHSRCNLEDSGQEMANRAERYAVTRNVNDTRKETISVARFELWSQRTYQTIPDTTAS